MDSKEKIENVKLDLQNVATMTDVKHNPVISAFVSSIKVISIILLFFLVLLSFSLPLNSAAACNAQRGGNGCKDRNGNLNQCFPSFFRHSFLVFRV